jgi:acetylornithine/N-succinyldiaminopimelate aminotransferase
MDEITKPGFLDDVNRKAGYLRQRLEGLVAAHPTSSQTSAAPA